MTTNENVRLLGQRNLARVLEVGDKVQDLVWLKCLKKAVRHHRESGVFTFYDFLKFDGDLLRRLLEREYLRRFRDNDSRQGPSVLQS